MDALLATTVRVLDWKVIFCNFSLGVARFGGRSCASGLIAAEGWGWGRFAAGPMFPGEFLLLILHKFKLLNFIRGTEHQDGFLFGKGTSRTIPMLDLMKRLAAYLDLDRRRFNFRAYYNFCLISSGFPWNQMSSCYLMPPAHKFDIIPSSRLFWIAPNVANRAAASLWRPMTSPSLLPWRRRSVP